MARRLRDLIVGEGHAQLGSARRAAIDQLHAAEFAGRRRFGDRAGERAQHGDAHSQDEVEPGDGDDDPDGGTKAVDKATAATNKAMCLFVVDIEVIAQRFHGYQTVRAGFIQRYKEAKTGDATYFT